VIQTMTRDQVLAEAEMYGRIIIDAPGIRIPPLEQQFFNSALDEVLLRGDAMPNETRELLISAMGVFMVRQRQ